MMKVIRLAAQNYKGTLEDEAILWTGTFSVEILGDDEIRLPLLPKHVTLTDVRVDGKRSSILVENNSFATIIKGKGSHEVTAEFQVTVQKNSGPPKITIPVPEVPVSRLDLNLPGRKELTVHPISNVTTNASDSGTVATAYIPMTNSVTLSWSEAVPESVKAELRANAGITTQFLLKREYYTFRQ